MATTSSASGLRFVRASRWLCLGGATLGAVGLLGWVSGVPGLTTIVASGHTPGMATFLVHSGNDQLLLTADLAYHPVVNVDVPWVPGPDRDKEAALASRRRIFDRAATDRIPVLGFHFPFPGLGRLLKTDGAYAWVPANWQF